MSSDNYEEVKVRNQTINLDLPRSVAAAMAAAREDFHKLMGSDPIVEQVFPDTFRITTFGGGDLQVCGQFQIKELPGCCGMVVFYHASVSAKFAGRGLGRLFLQVRQKAAVLAGYTAAMATVIKTNKAELAILEKEGWVNLYDFKNKRTSNCIEVLFKAL